MIRALEGIGPKILLTIGLVLPWAVAGCYLHTLPPEDAADLQHARRLGCMAMGHLDGGPARLELVEQQVSLAALARDTTDAGADGGVSCR